MRTAIQALTNGLLTLFLKSKCPLCDRPTDAELCEFCRRQLLRCQLNNPSHFWQEPLPVFVWGRYNGTLKQALSVLKYENQPQLARPLGHWLAETWLKSSTVPKSKRLIVIPIPLHPAKLQQRGYNQAELIAQSFCQVTGYKQLPSGLERVRATEAQFGLSPQEREQNLMDAFVIGKRGTHRLSSSSVLLLDDIYTTGATARSAAQTLNRQGIQIEGVVAIASSKDSSHGNVKIIRGDHQ